MKRRSFMKLILGGSALALLPRATPEILTCKDVADNIINQLLGPSNASTVGQLRLTRSLLGRTETVLSEPFPVCSIRPASNGSIDLTNEHDIVFDDLPEGTWFLDDLEIRDNEGNLLLHSNFSQREPVHPNQTVVVDLNVTIT